MVRTSDESLFHAVRKRSPHPTASTYWNSGGRGNRAPSKTNAETIARRWIMPLAADLRDRHSQLKLAIAPSDQNDPPVDDSSSNQGPFVVSLVLESPGANALFELIEPDERRKVFAILNDPTLQHDDSPLSLSCRVVQSDLPSPSALSPTRAILDRTGVDLSHGQRTRSRRGCLGGPLETSTSQAA